MTGRILLFACLLMLLAAPFLFRPSTEQAPKEARELIIITPHNEQVRTEFTLAFDAWHHDVYGERVNVIYNVPGGTSEIRRMLDAQYAAAFAAGSAPSGTADLVFGGGTYEHEHLRRGVEVVLDGQRRWEAITQPVQFEAEWLRAVYGKNRIGDSRLYDPDGYWFGTALSGFGIVFNRDVLGTLDVPEPRQWEALCDPRLRGWVALVNPGQSGSITTAFDAILQRRGWERGWQVLRRAGANARYFSASALKPPADVSQGDAALGVCIDFYGRYQAQAVAEGGDADRVGYVDPPGASTIDADPISMLRGAPHPELARRFIVFCLSERGQSLWQFRRRTSASDDLGPMMFELRRLPIRRDVYERYLDRMIDQINPFEPALATEHPIVHARSFVALIFEAMVMATHEDLQAAWAAVLAHPAYPRHQGVVTAADVQDPLLRQMLELLDAMPVVEGPGGTAHSLESSESLGLLEAGWLKKDWADAGLWPKEATPADVMQRRFASFFRANYKRIQNLARQEGSSNSG